MSRASVNPIRWQEEEASKEVKYVGHWKVVQVKVKNYDIRLEKPRCAKITLRLDRFDANFSKVIAFAANLALSSLENVDWSSPYPILATASRERKDASQDSSTEEEDSSADERGTKKSRRVAAVPLKYRDSSSPEDSSGDDEPKKPAARDLGFKKRGGRPPKAKAGLPAKRGRPKAKAAEPPAKRGRRPKKPKSTSPAATPASVTPSSTRRVTPTNRTPRTPKKPLKDYSPDEVAKLFDDKADVVSKLFHSDDDEEGQAVS